MDLLDRLIAEKGIKGITKDDVEMLIKSTTDEAAKKAFVEGASHAEALSIATDKVSSLCERILSMYGVKV